MAYDKRDIEKLFVGLGMSRSDSHTYTALLKHGAISIRKLADITGINRGTTYEALKRLTNIGLVSVRLQANREHFTAESPEKLQSLIRERRRELLDLSSVAKEIVPELLAERKGNNKAIAKYYEDDEGVVAILRDILETCRSLPTRGYYAYSSSPIRHYLYRQFPLFTARRIADGIKVKVIAVGEGGEETELSERRWLTQVSDAAMSSYTLIYGDKIATISITADDMPFGVVIEDAGAANLQRYIFEQLWSSLS